MRRRILVYCAAERTEYQYLNHLKKHLNPPGIALNIHGVNAAPRKTVEAALAEMRAAPDAHDEVWCVVDVDQFHRHGANLPDAIRLASRHGIELAISSPCFELWLLLHHADRTAAAKDCKELERAVRRYVKKYDKTKLRIADFVHGVDDAIARARRLRVDGPPHPNPSTSVWRLVEKITE